LMRTRAADHHRHLFSCQRAHPWPCARRSSGVGASPLPRGAPIAIRDLESDIESQIQLFGDVG